MRNKITGKELEELAKEFYVEMVKGAADIERKIIALGGEWHIDANEVLIKDGSKQKDIWGFNIYLNKPREERLEYNSLINIRPNQGNQNMEIENEDIRNNISNIINELVE